MLASMRRRRQPNSSRYRRLSTRHTAPSPPPEGFCPCTPTVRSCWPGGPADIDFITEYFRRLSPIALHGLRGNVFIEVESQFDRSIVDVPPGVGVHWLVREDIDGGSIEPGPPPCPGGAAVGPGVDHRQRRPLP